MKMWEERSRRGFSRIEFTDRFGYKCSIQESALESEKAIWFGCADQVVKGMIRGQGWVEVDLEEVVRGFEDVGIFPGRMHLTQDQVRELLPILQRFVDTGEVSLRGDDE